MIIFESGVLSCPTTIPFDRAANLKHCNYRPILSFNLNDTAVFILPKLFFFSNTQNYMHFFN